jgi:hypothetical protein
MAYYNRAIAKIKMGDLISAEEDKALYSEIESMKKLQ